VAVITIVFRTAATTAAVPEGHRMYAVRHDASCDPLRRCAFADLIHLPRNEVRASRPPPTTFRADPTLRSKPALRTIKIGGTEDHGYEHWLNIRVGGLADLAGAAGRPSLAANDLPVPNLTRQDRRQIRYNGDNDLRGQLLPVSAFLFAFAVEASQMHLERRLPRRRAS